MSKIVNIASWTQKRKTISLTLPSGAVVTVVENHLLPLITNSLMPLTLLAKVQQLENKSDGTLSEDQGKIIEGYNKLLNLITEIVVEPKITLADFVSIPGEDIQFLIQYLMRGRAAADLSSFRDGAGSAPVGSDVPQVQAAAVAGAGAAGA